MKASLKISFTVDVNGKQWVYHTSFNDVSNVFEVIRKMNMVPILGVHENLPQFQFQDNCKKVLMHFKDKGRFNTEQIQDFLMMKDDIKYYEYCNRIGLDLVKNRFADKYKEAKEGSKKKLVEFEINNEGKTYASLMEFMNANK